MEINSILQVDNFRKIEDVIEIQKAKGNYSTRQVAFNLLTESNSTKSTNLAKSLESGLSSEIVTPSIIQTKKKCKAKRSKSPLPDVVPWPSDSDITVLRMKLCITNDDIKQKVGSVMLGDGLHQPDSLSMINLATLIRETSSKSNLNVEEYLLPLTSWEHQNQECYPNIQEKLKPSIVSGINQKEIHDTRCSHVVNRNDFNSIDSDYCKNTKTSKLARFIRLYFCPCCTCLYDLEKMQDERSEYLAKHEVRIC